MLTRTGHISVVRSASARAALTLACLFAPGCAAPVMEYDDQFIRARIDNPDGDNIWDAADQNGNGTIDENEDYRPQVGFPAATASFTAQNPQPPPIRIPDVGFFAAGHSGFADGYLEDFSAGVDFDDLHTFNSGFGALAAKSLSRMSSVQVLQGLQFTNAIKNRDLPRIEHSVELSTGARFFRLTDNNVALGTGSILGIASQDTSMDNTSFGPQCTATWSARSDRWSVATTGSFFLGYHDVRGQQFSAISVDPAQGPLNRPLYAQPHYNYHELSDSQFSPLGEFDASASYQIATSLTCRLGYNVFYAGNLRYAQDSTNWVLPEFGLLDAPGRDLFQKTVYASIEFLR